MLVVGRLKAALAATVLMAVGFSAHADKSSNKKIKESGDWSLWETKGSTGVETCYIQSGGEDETYLVVIKAKNNPKSPVETMIQMLENRKGQTGIVVSVPGLASTLTYGDLDGKKFTFQGIPKNFAQAVEIIKNNKPELKLTKSGGKKGEETKISTRGFKDMVKEFESRCNAGQPIVDADYENQFINGVADSINPAILTPAKSESIRSIYFASYNVLLEKRATEAQLAQVLQKYQPQVDELKNNRARATAIQNSDLPAARNDLSQTQTQQATSRAEIAKQTQAIPGLTAKRDASQNALDAAEKIIAPLRPEYNRLTGSLGQAQSKLSSSQSRLNYINGRLPSINQEQSALENEAFRLEQILPSQRQEASMALSRYNQISRDRQSYNAQWRRDEMLRQSFEYQRLNQDWQRVARSMEMADRELRGVIRERDRVAADLRACQAGAIAPNAVAVEQLIPNGPHEPKPPGLVPGNPGGGLVPGPHPGPGGPGHGPGHGPGGPGHGPGPGPGQPPGGGGGGLTPGPSEPPGGGGLTPVDPPKDCSQYQNALQVANAQVSQKQSEVNGYSSQLRDIERRRERIVRDIDMQVDREYRQLVDAEEQARRAYDFANSTVFNNENRVAQIRRTELPRLASEEAQLLSERPNVSRAISDAQADIARLNSQLASFKSSNDWDRKEAAVNAKASQLRQDQSILDAATSSKALAERTLQNAIAREAQINAQITALNNELAALNARAVGLEQILAQLPAERAPIDQKIAGLAADLKARQDQVLNQLK